MATAPDAMEAQARWAARVACFSLLAWCAHAMATPIHDLDVWFHLSGAREIQQEGRIPFEDTFTWVGAGRPWLDLHWGFQVLIGAVHRSWGIPGLVLSKVVLGLAVAASLYSVVRALSRSLGSPSSEWPAVIALLPLGFAFSLRPILRPELLTYLLLVLQLRAFVAIRAGAGRAGLLVLLLQIGLVNVQGLFVLGWLVAGAFLIEALWRRRDVRYHLLLTLGVFLASALNPYGWQALELPFTLLRRIDGSASPFEAIAEFRGSFVRLDATAWLASGIVAVALVSALLPRVRREGLAFLGIALATLLLAWMARRNLTLAVLATGPLFAFLLARSWNPRWRLVGATSITIFGLTLVVDCWNGKRLQSFAGHPEMRLGLDGRALHEGSLAFLDSRSYEGRHFVDLNLGGYDVHRLGPPHRCLADARLEVLGAEDFARYLRMLGNPAFFEGTCEEFAFDAAIVDHRMPHQRIVLDHLMSSKAWRPVYADAGFFVFARVEAERARCLLERPSIPSHLLMSFPPAWRARLHESARGIALLEGAGT